MRPRRLGQTSRANGICRRVSSSRVPWALSRRRPVRPPAGVARAQLAEFVRQIPRQDQLIECRRGLAGAGTRLALVAGANCARRRAASIKRQEEGRPGGGSGRAHTHTHTTGGSQVKAKSGQTQTNDCKVKLSHTGAAPLCLCKSARLKLVLRPARQEPGAGGAGSREPGAKWQVGRLEHWRI